ncbi:MAG: protein translocase subunit SecDF [Flavobacteriales bacterium]|nr:protein translocase subunit SecDF [Flavobacteriales bacterium]|tara:strand:- start:2298 stop:5300 length:3003 start_codon:yes stop_codon:yes gene_type:complete
MEDKKFRTFVRGVLICFIIGFIYSLSFSYATYSLEKKAIETNSINSKEALSALYNNANNIKEIRVENDSLILSPSKSENGEIDDDRSKFFPLSFLWLDKYSYKDAKQNSLNLGLDLKGGMSVLLEISQRNILESLSSVSKNGKLGKIFNNALDNSDIVYKGNTQDTYLNIFRNEFNNLLLKDSIQDVSLFSIFESEDSFDFDRNSMSSSDLENEVVKYLDLKISDYIGKTFETIKRRIDQFGLANPTVKRIESSERILVELPGMTDEEMVKEYLSKTASLEFWKTKKNSEFSFLLSDSAFISFANIPNVSPGISDQDAPDIYSLNSPIIANINDTEKDRKIAKDYFESKLSDGVIGSDVVFYFTNNPAISNDATGKKIDNYDNYIQLIALEKSNDYGDFNGPVLLGKEVNNARDGFDERSGGVTISMNMTPTGAKRWAQITENEIGNEIAIVLDEIVYTYPTINEKIPTGSSVISGNFEVREAKDIASILNAGQLDAKVNIAGSEYVGPSLGQKSIDSGAKSFLMALVFVLIYMIFYYFHAGVASNLALVINMFFIFGALAAFNATLTLPGIAGIVLTIGMAVDANVLIYERIKEELSQQKGLALAVRDGYKNAYSAIIDANLTTLLTAVVLFYFGSGPIKGFATTLIIGILTSLFCAIFITRLVFESRLVKKKKIFFSNRLTTNLFRNTTISFIKRRKIAYVFSLTFILVGIFFLQTKGLNKGVDLQGGREYVYKVDYPELNTVEIRNILGEKFVEDNVNKFPEVKTYGNFGQTNQIKITTNFKISEEGSDSLVVTMIESQLAKYAGSKEKIEKISTQKVGATIADDVKRSAYFAILFSLIIIFLYILLRFRKWQFSLGAVAALFHDVLILLSIFSIFSGILPISLEIDQAFIAAVLTVIGYSLNDTVVVFDRVREFQTTKVGEFKDIINSALNSTLSRTINTSLTTIVVLLIIFFFGGEVIRGFMFALIIGVIVGTYSSLFIATPIMLDTSSKIEKKS